MAMREAAFSVLHTFPFQLTCNADYVVNQSDYIELCGTAECVRTQHFLELPGQADRAQTAQLNVGNRVMLNRVLPFIVIPAVRLRSYPTAGSHSSKVVLQAEHLVCRFAPN